MMLVNNQISLFIAGDSTASNYSPEVAPRAGWGQVLGHLFSEAVKVRNYAASGRSSKSFIEEGRLSNLLDQIQEKDYLFIQFGHNDAKPDERYTEPFTDFKSYLSQYIEGAKGKGAIPVLVTPVQRRSFNEAGRMTHTHGDYPAAVHQLGKELNVPVIDLGEKSKTLLEKMGEEKSKQVFLWLEAGASPNYPNGVEDNSHFQECGAILIARLVAEGMRELGLPLAEFLMDEKERG